MKQLFKSSSATKNHFAANRLIEMLLSILFLVELQYCLQAAAKWVYQYRSSTGSFEN